MCILNRLKMASVQPQLGPKERGAIAIVIETVGPLISFTFRAKLASSKGFCISLRPNGPRSPPRWGRSVERERWSWYKQQSIHPYDHFNYRSSFLLRKTNQIPLYLVVFNSPLFFAFPKKLHIRIVGGNKNALPFVGIF